MASLNLLQYQPYFLVLVGLFLVGVSLFYKLKSEELEKTGERCEGIIFKLGYRNSFGAPGSLSYTKDKITVRFVTNKKEWITEDLKTDIVLSYRGQYKEGEKVAVIYNPDNQTEFIIETKQSPKLAKALFLLVGLILAAGGIYELFKQ